MWMGRGGALLAAAFFLVIRGAIPGAPGGYVVVRKAIAAKPEPQVQVEKASKVTVAKKAKK